MDGFVRVKRVTDPLANKFKAHLIGAAKLSYTSSGSEHSVDDSDPCLSELVHGFLHDDRDANAAPAYDSDSDRVDSVPGCSLALETIAALTSLANSDSYRNLVNSHVSGAMELFSGFCMEKSVFRRKIMSRLRELGHNAAICKTKWSSATSGGVTAGNYEFIDVLHSSTQTRYIIDLDFPSEFEIARPTSDYRGLLQSLPMVFVGRSEELKRIVKAISDSARRSLKSRGLSVPPWRKKQYVQNKWLGPYRRTVNPIPTNSVTPAIAAVNAVKCRYVGFDDAVNGPLFVRTR